MPYLMGGFPGLDASRAIGEAYADAGADLVELGVPFSDPLADGPVDPGRRHRRTAAGATVDGVLAVAERSPPRFRWSSCATRTSCCARRRGFAARAGRGAAPAG